MPKRKDAKKSFDPLLIEKIESAIIDLFSEAAPKFGFKPFELSDAEKRKLEAVFPKIAWLKPNFFFLFSNGDKRYIFTVQGAGSDIIDGYRVGFICAHFDGYLERYFNTREQYLAAEKFISRLNLETAQSGDFIKYELKGIVYDILKRVFLIDQLDEKFVPIRPNQAPIKQ